ncbi:polyprenyl synthetase family protein [Streptomyces sp. NRRL B-1347]|uniref:polyprenyl synthetase family protein n=1 Tax=Streptomyces sp. NRRL B-1347 TaxID=1476877 RepID=UPI0004CB9223|nr:polyprenyl synthetase family protein [Streptomyces sp. NRRL B-1347]
MTDTVLVDQPLDLAALRAEVDTVLRGFLAHKAAAAAAQRLPQEAVRALEDFLAAGGKRLRPLLCVTGWQAAGGHGPIAPVVQVGAALEIFHIFALIHDDIMDDAATRRGRPTLHHTLATRHAHGRTQAGAERLGTGAAILIGDLALTWSDEILHTAGLTPAQLKAVLPVISTMRTEVMYGQYLDLLTTGCPTTDLDTALRIVRYKTAKYTCERPLHIGAALAGADTRLLDELTAYALPMGEAFQLRDDLLGVFGNPADTGKPVLDDLREAKHTALIALALQRADSRQAGILRRLVGDPDLDEESAATARGILRSTGADTAVEDMIHDRYTQAVRSLEGAAFTLASLPVLHQLADKAAWRTA